MIQNKTFFIVSLLFFVMFSMPAHAVLKIDITEGNSDPIRISTPAFSGSTQTSASIAKKITGVIDNNLNRSGLFKVINKSAYIQNFKGINTIPDFAGWKNIRSQALLVGRVESTGGNNLVVKFRLWDIITGTVSYTHLTLPTTSRV